MKLKIILSIAAFFLSLGALQAGTLEDFIAGSRDKILAGQAVDLESIRHEHFDIDNVSKYQFELSELLSPKEVLQIVLRAKIEVWDQATRRSRIDEAKQKIQVDLAEALYERGARLADDGLLPYNLDEFYQNWNVFLKYEDSTKILAHVVKISYGIDEAKAKKQGELLELLHKRGVDLKAYLMKNPWSAFTIVIRNPDLMFDVLGPDLFLFLTLSYTTGIERFREEKLKSAKKAIAAGANVNFNLGGHGLLNSALGSIDCNNLAEDEIFILLIENGAKCQFAKLSEMIEGGLALHMLNPRHFIEQKYKNLGAQISAEAKVPYIVHHIWLTHPSSLNEARSQDIDNAIATKAIFAKGKAAWRHIVWTNDLSLIPSSAKELEAAGIEVRSIYEYKDDLKLFSLVENLIEEKAWGKASDTLRYSLVQKFGGVYADINFIFNRDVTEETHKYNFFSMTYGGLYIDNFFFGSSPGHPVIEEMLRLVERNLVNPPHYLSSIVNQDHFVLTDMGTASPTYLAYYSQANKAGNVDVVYPLLNYEYNEGGGFMENFSQEFAICSEHKIYHELREALHVHEICGSDDFAIGKDSSDGLTWMDK